MCMDEGEQEMECFEYIATYVDECIAAQDPGKIIQTLKVDYKLKVKGDRPLSHHWVQITPETKAKL